MKSNSKILAVGLGVALAFGILPAKAQLSSDGSLNGGTNNIAATATNTYSGETFVLPVNTRAITFQASLALNGTGTSAVKFVLDSSADSSHWESGTTNFSVTANGTNSATAMLNLEPAGRRYWRVASGGNANANAATNLLFQIGITRSGQ